MTTPHINPHNTPRKMHICHTQHPQPKKWTKNQSAHQEATGIDTCSITAIIRQFTTICGKTRNPQTCISTYFTHNSTDARLLHSSNITAMIKHAVTIQNLERHRLSPNLVGSHSLRASGAMAIYLNGVDITTIEKLGRWGSNLFLMYIHKQIAPLSANMSTLMSN